MCILFMYNGSDEEDSDYSLILATNRDEYYDRAAQNMTAWSDDPSVIAGRDLGATDCSDSTWLALSPLRGKLGVLLNLPGKSKENSKSRGRLASDFARTSKNTKEYIESIKDYANECNEFVFVTAEFGCGNCSVTVYNNATNDLSVLSDTHLGFGNSLPDKPLKKVEAGRCRMMDICRRYNKTSYERQLVEKLIELLKWDERHLPDYQLENRNRKPQLYEELSSLFVSVPKVRYGTRTHTIILITKKGRVNVVEITMRSPVDLDDIKWDRTELQFDIQDNQL